MNDSVGFLILIQVILIALNAVFASAEIAVLSLNDVRLEKLAAQGNKKADRLSRLTRNPAKFLATIQVAITLSGFLGSAFAAENFSDTLTDWIISLGVTVPRATLDTLSVILITLILSYVTLIFGELVPKRIAMKKSEQLSLALSGIITGLSGLFTPIVWLLSASTNAVLRLCGIDPNEDPEEVSEEEIRMMVDAGSEKGVIHYDEKEFIQNVFEFDDLMVGEIATHRTDTVFLRMEDSDEEWEKSIHDSRHTLYPVCEESQDNVIGILNARDYFRLSDRSRAAVMEQAVKPAYFVAETVKADVMFRRMKRDRVTLAVVLDEYGGMVGIITRNDLVEQLVGNLQDEETEFEEQEPYMEKSGEDCWLLHGNLPLKQIGEAVGFQLEYEDIDTLTGLVFDQLCTIPDDGDQQLDVEIGRLHIQVQRIEEHQISQAVLHLLPATAESFRRKTEAVALSAKI